MNNGPHIRQNHASGFSAIRLVIAVGLVWIVLALLASLLIPRVPAPLRGRITKAMADGKVIHDALSYCSRPIEIVDPVWDGCWPLYGKTMVGNYQFSNSTDLFISMTTVGVMDVQFSFFAPYGVKPATGWYQTFTSTNNGWCVVGNVDETYPDDAPILFTSNLAIPSMDTPIVEENGWLSPSLLPQDKHAPFRGRDAFVFATKNGQVFGLYGELLKYESFTNLFRQVTTNGVRLTNPILRP